MIANPKIMFKYLQQLILFDSNIPEGKSHLIDLNKLDGLHYFICPSYTKPLLKQKPDPRGF